MPKSQQSWYESQHPPTQWNGAADKTVLIKEHKYPGQQSRKKYFQQHA
jgi:hypothetical protein